MDAVPHPCAYCNRISIRATLAGGDYLWNTAKQNPAYFNPRHPCGWRQQKRTKLRFNYYIACTNPLRNKAIWHLFRCYFLFYTPNSVICMVRTRQHIRVYCRFALLVVFIIKLRACKINNPYSPIFSCALCLKTMRTMKANRPFLHKPLVVLTFCLAAAYQIV